MNVARSAHTVLLGVVITLLYACVQILGIHILTNNRYVQWRLMVLEIAT